ncbi:MAG: hypothetical protein AAGH72_05255 [Verrucomicrobiota bacterium]
MDNATQGSGNRSSNNRRGRNNNRNRNRNRNRGRSRNRSRNAAPKKTQNPILAFFSNLFGISSKPQKKNTQRKERSSSKRKERSPKPADEQPQVTSARLYVGNLSYDTAESDLFDHFGTVGQVKSAEIVRDRSERSKGFGFVEMNSVETAQTASEKYHRTEYMGRQIIVAGAKN